MSLLICLSLLPLWVFSSLCTVLVTRNAICEFVYLKMFVTFLIKGLWNSKVIHFFGFVVCVVCILSFRFLNSYDPLT
jgi:hypothetical protein